MNKKDLLASLDKLGMRPGRGLGQNFLLDGNLLDWIARNSGFNSGDNVLEVGPGFGALTSRLLSSGAKVTAIEFDHRIVEYLKKEIPNPDFRLVEGDACRVKIDDLFPIDTPFRAIANLPYSISSVFIANLLNLKNLPLSMCFMLQKEMADRLVASPGSKDYGSLTIRVQALYDAKIIRVVPPDVFYPPPQVDSAVVAFVKRSVIPPESVLKRLSGIVRSVFAQRRKQIGKILSGYCGKDVALAALAEAGITPDLRPDKIDIPGFIKLAEAVGKIAEEK